MLQSTEEEQIEDLVQSFKEIQNVPKYVLKICFDLC